MREAETPGNETSRSPKKIFNRGRNAPYALYDPDLVRQNALLTRLLLEREARGTSVPILDTASFLETQSLPGNIIYI